MAYIDIKEENIVDLFLSVEELDNFHFNLKKIKLFRLTHHYSIDKSKSDLYFISDESLIDIAEKCVWLQFKTEELIDDAIVLEESELFIWLQKIAKALEVDIRCEVDNEKILELEMYQLREGFFKKRAYLMNKYSDNSKLIDKLILKEKEPYFQGIEKNYRELFGEKEALDMLKLNYPKEYN